MKRVLLIAAAVLVVGLFGLLTWLNPEPTLFRFTTEQSVQLPLGWLLVFAFVGGAVTALLASSLRDAARRLMGWRGRRQARQASRVSMWQREGTTLAWDGELEKARQVLHKAWRSGKGNRAAALALAASYAETSELDSACRILEEATEQDSSDPDLRYALAEVHRRRGNRDEASRLLETIRVQHPRAARVLIALRDLYQEAERWSDAVRIQESLVETLPKGTPALGEQQRLLHFRYQAALALEDANARRDALAALTQAFPDFAPAAVSLGDCLVKAGQTSEAVRCWERAFKTTHRGVLFERLLAHQSTPRDRQRVLALLKKYQPQMDADEVRLLVARAALEDGNVDLVEAELEGISRSDLPGVQRLWTEIHRRRGQLDKALRFSTQLADRAAPLKGYSCSACGEQAETWSGYCSGCQRWDTYRPTLGGTAAG
jgi:lipopolysaccharide biosynthesis regulator YciM